MTKEDREPDYESMHPVAAERLREIRETGEWLERLARKLGVEDELREYLQQRRDSTDDAK